MPAPEPKKPDPLVLLARASAAKRPRHIWPTVILLALLGSFVGGFVWWFWPRGEYPAVALAVFDQAVLAEEPVTITARLEPLQAIEGNPHLEGNALFLHEADSPDFVKAETGADGFARFVKTFSEDVERVDFEVRYAGIPGHRRSLLASAQVFVWPEEAQLLLVDADTTLAEGDEAKLWATENIDLRPRPGAAATLQTATKRYRIVYLSDSADTVVRYNKLRAWLLGRATTPGGRLPPGPLYGPAALAEDDRATFTPRTLATLRKHFQEDGLAVTSDPNLARLLHRAGLEVCFLGEPKEPLEGIHPVKSWAEVRKRLKP